MRPQRVRARQKAGGRRQIFTGKSGAGDEKGTQPRTAESRMEMQIVKWTAEGAVKGVKAQ
ncbi:MAG: hypothetical protein LUI87_16045 [Lachnospiraceae bacterium]|nr:hypothetical protein [Lachnospiraceae bacterium]